MLPHSVTVCIIDLCVYLILIFHTQCTLLEYHFHALSVKFKLQMNVLHFRLKYRPRSNTAADIESHVSYWDFIDDIHSKSSMFYNFKYQTPDSGVSIQLLKLLFQTSHEHNHDFSLAAIYLHNLKANISNCTTCTVNNEHTLQHKCMQIHCNCFKKSL